VRGTWRNVIVWNSYWVLLGAVGEAALRGTERNGLVWYWDRVFFGAGSERDLR